VPVEAPDLAGVFRDDEVVGVQPGVDLPPPSAQLEVPSAQLEVPPVRLGGTVGSLRIKPQAHRARRPRPVTLVATGTLVGAAVLAIAFAAGRGGISLSFVGAPDGSGAGAASSVPSAPNSAASTAAASGDASASSGALPSALPSPQSSGTASQSPAASPDRMALLKPCPGLPNCYQYRIRRYDNLRGIASFFGVPYQTVLDLNPQIENPSLIRVGQVIILPPPGP
jgi:nucleoid-associated protein YgaU